jgi:hypothetical protein
MDAYSEVRRFPIARFVFPLLLGLGLAFPAFAQEVPRIEPDRLEALLGAPDLVLLDVRAESQWRKSDRKIRGARRVNPDRPETWIGSLGRESRIVLYCE